MKAAAVFLALTACATPEVEPPLTGELTCEGTALEGLAGRQYSESLGKDAMRKSKSGVLRIIRPGQPITMDYRTDRLNIELHEDGKILRVNCG